MQQAIANKYNGWAFRIIGSLIISHVILTLQQDKSFFNLILHKYYYIDLGLGFIATLAIWIYVHKINKALQKRYDWFKNPFLRLSSQLVLAFFIPSLMTILFTYFFFTYIFHENFFLRNWLNTEYIVCNLIIFIVNLAYFIFYLVEKLNSPNKGASSDIILHPQSLATDYNASLSNKRGKKTTLRVSKGDSNIILTLKEIAYVFKVNQHTFVKTSENVSYLFQGSLDKVENELDELHFFRINRHFLINKSAISSYKSIENGKIEVFTMPTFKERIIISQKRAKYFRNWVKDHVAVS